MMGYRSAIPFFGYGKSEQLLEEGVQLIIGCSRRNEPKEGCEENGKMVARTYRLQSTNLCFRAR